MSITREKRIRLGKLHLAIGMDAADAERLRRTAAYKRVIGPALRFLGGSGGRPVARAGGSPNGHRTPVASLVPSSPSSPQVQEILGQVAEIEWYHVIELPHGMVTPGFVDHRDQVPLYGLPDDMTGMRALDVATYDGFWAREMERRGADVVAIDIESMAEVDLPRNWLEKAAEAGIDKPTGAGFGLASRLLGSKVKREICNVYDLGPEKFGMFDVAICSDLLLHLRDPLKAIENIWRVVNNFAIFADVYDPSLESINAPVTEFAMGESTAMWWRPNVQCLVRMLRVARFSHVEKVSDFALNADIQRTMHKVVLKAYR